MTLSTNTPTRFLHQRLARLEACAEHAPEGTYNHAKRLVTSLNEAFYALTGALRARNLKTSGLDPARDLAANIFGYVLASDPDLELNLAAAEGFGDAVEHPGELRDRVVAAAARDRDALKAAKGWK